MTNLFKQVLCPACINDYEGQIGTELEDMLAPGLSVEIALCEKHQDRNLLDESDKAIERAKKYAKDMN